MEKPLKQVAEWMWVCRRVALATGHDSQVDWNETVMFLSQELCEQNFPGAEEVLEFEQACGGLF